MNLDKIVYAKLEDGAYTLIPARWELKVTPATPAQEYVALFCKIKESDRPVQVNLFEKGLDIFASNVKAHLELGEVTLAQLLDLVVGKELPATHETVTIDTKTYYNWHVARTQTQASEVADEEF